MKPKEAGRKQQIFLTAAFFRMNIVVREDSDGIAYENHLLASQETGIAKIKLNGGRLH